MTTKIIRVLHTNLMILVVILFLCKLEGQNITIIYGIHGCWIQHTQIDFKKIDTVFNFKNAPNTSISQQEVD